MGSEWDRLECWPIPLLEITLSSSVVSLVVQFFRRSSGVPNWAGATQVSDLPSRLAHSLVVNQGEGKTSHSVGRLDSKLDEFFNRFASLVFEGIGDIDR